MFLKQSFNLTKKLIKDTHSFCKWFYIFFIHSPRFEIYVKKSNKLNKKYFSIVRDDRVNKTDTHLQPYYFKTIPKRVWIYWAQGEVNSPFVVQECIDSWRKHNPDWEIKVLDENNLASFVELPELPNMLPVRYQANLLRTMLLKQYGGVWADATTYCHRPLNEWLPLLANSGFFMFTNPTQDRDIENWFIASSINHPLIAGWQKQLETYYLRSKKTHPAYFLAFYIYQWMLKEDKYLSNLHRNCSALNAGQCFLMKSAMLGNTEFMDLKTHIGNGLPLSKLDWRLEITDDEIQKFLSKLKN